MSLLSLSDWINLLLSGIQTLQDAFLHVLAAVGLTHNSHGQAAWPFAQRLSGEVLLIDRGVARQLLNALALTLAALISLLVALLWRRGRAVMLLTTVALLFFTSWPDSRLLLAPAQATSFHVSPSGFSAAAIVHGQQIYTQRCASCHAVDGKGDTPLALSLPTYPPNLASGLLWRRADGDLFWHIAYGMRDRHGAATMPGFTKQLSDADVWSLIDFMKANAAGASVRDSGAWDQPVALPAMTANCLNTATPTQSISQWRGQRTRVILASTRQDYPLDDPRMRSLILSAGPVSRPSSQPGAPAIDCVARSEQAWQALAIITGTDSDKLAGTQLLIDRDGWLRARKLPGAASSNWSESDILCRAPTAVSTPSPDTHGQRPGNGLDGLIAAMDAEPVRFVKGGFVHSTQ